MAQTDEGQQPCPTLSWHRLVPPAPGDSVYKAEEQTVTQGELVSGPWWGTLLEPSEDPGVCGCAVQTPRASSGISTPGTPHTGPPGRSWVDTGGSGFGRGPQTLYPWGPVEGGSEHGVGRLLPSELGQVPKPWESWF